MFGVLNINKPYGWTSRDVVNRVQRLVRPYKVGHAGTLDPLASGVLVVCIGQATRLIQYAHRLPKFYRATFLLGRSSPTDDVEGEISLMEPKSPPSRQEIAGALPGFLGTILQVPPQYSAVKVQGRRAYELARLGRDVHLTAKLVTIHVLEIVSYQYPELVLDIECGTGTYIRSLGRDLAKSLGTCAVMAGLERQWVGNLHVSRSVSVEQLQGHVEEYLLSPRILVDALTWVRLTQEEIGELSHGRPISHRDRRIEPASWPDNRSLVETVGVDQDGRIMAILRLADDGLFRPVCHFAPSV